LTSNGEAAVLVLAAGAGTRMRSDTPKVLHALAGRSMLSHALHSVAKAAPAHLVVVLGHDRDRVAPAVGALADELGRPIQVAVQEQQLGTGHAVGCGLSALPEDFTDIVVVTSGDVPLLDADTLAGLAASCAPRTVRAGIFWASSNRPTPARRSSPSVRSTPASTRSTSRHCARRWTGCGPTTPSTSST